MSIRKQSHAVHSGYDRLEKYAFLLTVAACLGGSVGSSVLMLGITAMFAPLILRPEHLLGPVLFFSIFDDFLLVASDASASRFLTIFLIMGIAILVLRRGTIKRISLYFILLIALGTVLSFYSALGYTSLPISYILNLLLTIAMSNLSGVSAQKISKQLYRYAVLTLVYVYFLLMKNGFDALADGSRMSIAENVNSNALAMGLAVVMALLVSDLLLFKNHVVVDTLLIAANLIALFLTGSRTALIAAVVAAFVLFMLNAQDRRSRGKAFLLLIVSILLLVTIYGILQKYFPALMQRFAVDSVKDSGGTGRIDVWKSFFIHLFPKHWLVGVGFDQLNFFYAIKSVNGIGHGPHNIVVEMLSTTGVIGTTMYVVCFIRYFYAVVKNLRTNKHLLVSAGIVISILINGIGENSLGTRFLWFGIGLGYMLLNANTESGSNP